MLTYAPCNYYNPSRNRRGGFHIRPCYFPVIAHLTAKFVRGGVRDAPCPFALQTLFPFLRKHSQHAFCRGRCSHRPAGEHCSPYNHRTFSNNQKGACANPAHAPFYFFAIPGRTPQTPAKYSGFPPPASGVPGATARPAQNGIPADTRLRSAHPGPPPARAAPVPAP